MQKYFSAGGEKNQQTKKYYSAIQSIVVYLNSPRRRREKKSQENVLQHYTKYRCVPKIASPEARNNFRKKTYYSPIQSCLIMPIVPVLACSQWRNFLFLQ